MGQLRSPTAYAPSALNLSLARVSMPLPSRLNGVDVSASTHLVTLGPLQRLHCQRVTIDTSPPTRLVSLAPPVVPLVTIDPLTVYLTLGQGGALKWGDADVELDGHPTAE